MARTRGGKSHSGPRTPPPSKVVIEEVAFECQILPVNSLQDPILVSDSAPSITDESALGATNPPRDQSKSRSAPVLRTCPTCHRSNSITSDDPHPECQLCLGQFHYMKNCQHCGAMRIRIRLARARSLLLWRRGVTDHPLTRLQYNERKAELERYKWTQQEYLLRFLGLPSGSVGPTCQDLAHKGA